MDAINELASSVVIVESDDDVELKRIRDSLLSISNSASETEDVQHLAIEASNWLEKIINDECDDAEDALDKIRDIVSSMQKLFDKDELNDNPFVAGSDNTKQVETEVKKDVETKPEGNPNSTDENENIFRVEEKSEPVSSSVMHVSPPLVEDEIVFSEDPELVAEFVNESRDHIQKSEAALLKLESDPRDMEALNSVFRAFHTIKGTSGFLNLVNVQTLAHRAENLLDHARKEEIKLQGGYADLALESLDMLKEMIGRLEEGIGKPMPGPPDGYCCLVERLTNPEKHGISETSQREEPEAPRLGDILVATGKITRKKLEKIIKEQGGKMIGEALVQSGEVAAQDVIKALRSQKKIVENVSSELTVRVSTDRLDNLINMVGEIVITQTQIAQNEYILKGTDRKLSGNVSQLSKIMRELQDVSMSLRMVPLKTTFQKMARLVRDLARKTGKSIEFISEGEDTEIDRNMVELINDPLVHMIRNAVDHGIELPEERITSGKKDTGVIILKAYHSAGKVILELHDDGRGLDAAKIARKAIEKGLISAETKIPESELFKLIFAPGFSTAEQVTDVSGRGVGMDVVRKNIESIRGKVDIASSKGKGSTFTVRIPLTLAIIDGMALTVGSEQYLVPTLNVQQSFQPEKSLLHSVQGKGEMVMLRGSLLPIFRLHKLFNIGDAIEDPSKGLLIVVKHEDEVCTLLADTLLGQSQVVVKSLGQSLCDVEGIAGAAILGDGRVGLILDVAGIINIARGEQENGKSKIEQTRIENTSQAADTVLKREVQ